MNRKYISAIAAFLILGVLLSATPLAYAQTLAFGPKLEVVTIPQDNQLLKKGVIILGITGPGYADPGPTDLLSQHKLIVTYNGLTLTWDVGTAGPTIACNVLEKDKVNVVPDPKTGDGKQGDYENLMTSLVDVSDKFVCKPRWKSPAPGVYESVGVLDVYYVGPLTAAQDVVNGVNTGGVTGVSVGAWIADNILVVEAYFTVGRTVVFGSDIQDICVLGWPITGTTVALPALAPDYIITKPDGTQHYIWQNPMGAFVGCEELALAQRDTLGILLATGQDPLALAAA
jgi:hypothetical protein